MNLILGPTGGRRSDFQIFGHRSTDDHELWSVPLVTRGMSL